MAARLSVRRTRRSGTGVFRLKKPFWIDPFPFIPGTEPEKRLFDALVRRHLYFVFQDTLPELNDATGKDKNKFPFLFTPAFQPDFIIPEYRVILDPFGIFHHSLPDALKNDALKSVWYRALGYHFYHPWWDDRGFLLEDNGRFQRVGYDALAVLDSIPELRRGPTAKLKNPKDIAAKKNPGYRIGKSVGAGASSVAIANAMRKKQKSLTFRPSGRRRSVRRRV